MYAPLLPSLPSLSHAQVLGTNCMEFYPSKRPSFIEVLAEVNSILSDTMEILQQFLAASSTHGGSSSKGAPHQR